MKKTFKLIVLLMLGLLALSGCSAVRAILSGGSADEPAAEEAVVASGLIFYDSWASW